MNTTLVSHFGMRRTLFILVLLSNLLAMLILSTGCGTGLNLVSMEEEWQLGQQLEQDLNQQLTLVNDPTINRYIERMGQSIVQNTAMANRSWRFYVVQDENINAFNAPGGLVYVHTGLIAQTRNAAELASVVAHEIAHGTERHGTQRLSQVYGINIAASILLGQDPGMLSQIAAQIVAGGAVASFSRGQEREADQLGIRYMADAGYNPEGMVTMFELLMEQQQRQPGAVERIFSTHPMTSDRVAAARRDARAIQRSGLRMNDNDFNAVRARARQY